MKYIIVEDEDHGAELLFALISSLFPQLTFAGRARGVPDGIELISSENPSILFLDIEIEKGSGFDILDKVKLTNTLIIFTTGYNEFAIRAIKYGAYDYLLKPIQKDELQVAVENAINLIKRGEIKSQYYINPIADNFQSIVFTHRNERILVKPFEIIYLEADGKYCNVLLSGEKHITSSYNLGHYESILPKDIFIRVHYSSIVNKMHINHLDIKNCIAVLKNGQKISISKRKLKEVIASM